MLIVPKEKPFLAGLNTYYLDIRKLFEHYQGEYGSGGICFQSPTAEGILFFDKDELLNGVFQNGDGEIQGRIAIDRIIDAVSQHNFNVNTYKIDDEIIYFWANMPSAKPLYQGLTTEFTDLEGLINKVATENLTGFVNISIGDGTESGLLLIMNGKINGGSYSWEDGVVKGTKENNELLVSKTVESGGTLDVSQISMMNEEDNKASKEAGAKSFSETVIALEQLLVHLEDAVASNKKIKGTFSQLLKKKFLEKTNKYSFLDPFAAEFQYSNKRISYVGNATEEEIKKGVRESVKELAEELGIMPQVKDKLE